MFSDRDSSSAKQRLDKVRNCSLKEERDINDEIQD
jgi:hypothetical protein